MRQRGFFPALLLRRFRRPKSQRAPRTLQEFTSHLTPLCPDTKIGLTKRLTPGTICSYACTWLVFMNVAGFSSFDLSASGTTEPTSAALVQCLANAWVTDRTLQMTSFATTAMMADEYILPPAVAQPALPFAWTALQSFWLFVSPPTTGVQSNDSTVIANKLISHSNESKSIKAEESIGIFLHGNYVWFTTSSVLGAIQRRRSCCFAFCIFPHEARHQNPIPRLFSQTRFGG